VDRVLDKAQNGPPDGEADGTISESMWRLSREYANAALLAQSKRIMVMHELDECLLVNSRRAFDPHR
jgi:hypothetical protein